MSESEEDTMNLKLTNAMRGSQRLEELKKAETSIKEERRRTGRYIAILVGISLFLLAMYHAWVRKIPIVASLVVPALIMFVYVAWVLYSAARDKKRLLALDAEAALQAQNAEAAENENHLSEDQGSNIEIAVISNKDNSNLNTPEDSTLRDLVEITPYKDEIFKVETDNRFTMPIILINDKLPEDFDQKWIQVVESLTNCDRFKSYHAKRKNKRKFCRKKQIIYKRSYSIA